MNRYVNAISGRLSLRPPQRQSLEVLDRIVEISPPNKEGDTAAALSIIKSEYPSVSEFERDFPSVCFALATGVGKTRLMGAFISYLHLAHGMNNFFVLAPNLTIYNKLIADFTPNTPKYVFTGIAEFATEPPEVITGDNYEQRAGTLFDELIRCKVNIFNISKINSEVRGGKAPKIKRLSEYIGQSYFDYLSGLKDLVLIMDESHRYRASAGTRALNELKPVLALELTATPFVETSKCAIPFKNVIVDYPLGRAMADGFVKEPAVVTRKNFNPTGMSQPEIERLKLEDGLRLHESVKVELETYALESGRKVVKPFLLVIARDTTHAAQLLKQIQSEEFFEGRYKEKVIQVDSSTTGSKEDEMVQRLLDVEKTEEPTEIVIHVNMLKEGWDVTNLYTIVPLRAANARILIEQSIGRGLRLPYGRRTGVSSVDRLNIVAHDKFQEIIDEANRPDSTIRLQQVVLTDEQLRNGTVTVISKSHITAGLGIGPAPIAPTTTDGQEPKPLFTNAAEQRIAQIAFNAIKKLETSPDKVPSLNYLQLPEVQSMLVDEVNSVQEPVQTELEGLTEKPDVAAIIAKTAQFIINQTINIPRILVVPKGEVKTGFSEFTLDVSSMQYPAPDEELWIKHLSTGRLETLGLNNEGDAEGRLEDYVVSGLVDFDDIAYDHHADLLYDLSGQAVAHFKSYLKDDKEVEMVLRIHQREIARNIHAQMQEHFWEGETEYETVISRGFTELKDCAYTAGKDEEPLDLHHSPADKSNMAKYLFAGFEKCLYPYQKFHSDSERRLAVILDRETQKWFRPAKGQFQIFYRYGHEHPEYQPDFVAETEDRILMLEPKAKNEMDDPEVLAKRDAAVIWCEQATEHASKHNGKPWVYALIPHDAIIDNMTAEMLVKQFRCRIGQ